MIYTKDNQVAVCIADTGYIITEELTGFGTEKSYKVERIEPFDPEGWEEGSTDDWLNVWEPLIGMAEAANELLSDKT